MSSSLATSPASIGVSSPSAAAFRTAAIAVAASAGLRRNETRALSFNIDTPTYQAITWGSQADLRSKARAP